MRRILIILAVLAVLLASLAALWVATRADGAGVGVEFYVVSLAGAVYGIAPR